MKIWVDAQLPPILATWLNENFELRAAALRDLELRDAQDIEIFNAARAEQAAILTKDSDFSVRSIRSTPPDLIRRFWAITSLFGELTRSICRITPRKQGIICQIR
ncbi:MAG: DUF5615 family PIN-like protein [Cyanobacteria bacterium P01_H01_bin.119]